ncbi:ADP-ribosylglycohydrolase family protein [Kocuria rhizophila]
MTTEHTPELLARDQGLDATSDRYPDLVRGVVLAPWIAAGTDRPDQATQLAARTVAALDEVAGWANDGQSADPTACAWLSYLRWAVANGARLPDDAPHPPSDDLDRHHPVLAAPGEHSGDSFEALATGSLGEVVRPVLPAADSPEILARTAPYGLIPTIGWKTLVALAVDSAAITHGSPEAQTAAVGMALAVHAAAHAAETGATVQDVLDETTRVCAVVTRPAPHTLELLAQCAEPGSRRQLLSAAPDLAARGEHAASTALALGLAALVETAPTQSPTSATPGDDAARRASAALPGDTPVHMAARAVATTVAAARWGLSGTGPAEPDTPGTSARDATRADLLALADEWISRWCA